MHHAFHSLIADERQGYYCDYGTIEVLAETMANAYRFRDTWSAYRGRTHGRALDLSHVAPWRMVTYTTNHDQVGNRAGGDRPSQSESPEQLMLRAATVLLSPFTPMLFMGEEFGARTPFPFFVSHTDPELVRLTREGRRHDFAREGWNEADVPDPADPATFDSAKLDWEFDEQQQKLLNAYRTLIRLRHSHGFNRDDLRTLEVSHDEAGWLCLREGNTAFVGNYSPNTVTVPVGGELVYSFSNPQVGPSETVLGPWEFALIEG